MNIKPTRGFIKPTTLVTFTTLVILHRPITPCYYIYVVAPSNNTLVIFISVINAFAIAVKVYFVENFADILQDLGKYCWIYLHFVLKNLQ